MAVMARKKPETEAPKKPETETPKNRARDAGEVVPLGVEVSAFHKLALDECAKRERRTKRVVAEQALEAYFASVGLWPLPADLRPDA